MGWAAIRVERYLRSPSRVKLLLGGATALGILALPIAASALLAFQAILADHAGDEGSTMIRGLFAVSLLAAYSAIALISLLLIVPIGSALACAILHHGSLHLGDGPALVLAVVTTTIASSGIGAAVCLIGSWAFEAPNRSLQEHIASTGPFVAVLALVMGGFAMVTVLLIDEFSA